MIPCTTCRRHLHEADRICPFCAAEQRTEPSPVGALMLAAAIMLGSNACAKDSVSAEDTTSGSSEDSTTSATESGETDGTDSTSSTQGDTTDSASDTFDTSLSFYAGPDDDYPQVSECDPFAQDCPEGEKCVPYGSSGGNWDANKCVPVLGDDQPGDPCVSDGVSTATDTCDATSICWDVMDVDGMNVGVCTEFCLGTPDDPICPEQTSCMIANEGSISLCVPTCDPLLQDCGAGLACYWTNNDFNCVFTTQDIPLGEPCGYINDCIPGTGCLAADVLPDCMGAACCGSYCSLSDPICPQPGTECVSFYEDGQAPPNHLDIGVCTIPGA